MCDKSFKGYLDFNELPQQLHRVTFFTPNPETSSSFNKYPTI